MSLCLLEIGSSSTLLTVYNSRKLTRGGAQTFSDHYVFSCLEKQADRQIDVNKRCAHRSIDLLAAAWPVWFSGCQTQTEKHSTFHPEIVSLNLQSTVAGSRASRLAALSGASAVYLQSYTHNDPRHWPISEPPLPRVHVHKQVNGHKSIFEFLSVRKWSNGQSL